MKTDAALWPNPRRLAAVTALLAALFCFFLVLASHTPRGRLNVMQFGAMVFFLLVIARRWSGMAFERSARMDESRYRAMWLPVAVGAAVWLFSLPVGFINDDFSLVYGAQEAGWGHFRQFLQSQSGVFFRPLGYASIFLDDRIWGLWAPGYHLTNIALHLATAAGLYCLCVELGADKETSATAALIYVVLPVQAEAIVWIGCRFGLLSDALLIGAAVLYLRYRNTEGKGGSALARGGALACFALAALSKESAFVFPALLIVFELFFTARRKLRPVAEFCGVAAALFAVRWVMMGGIGGYANVPGGPPATLDIGWKTWEGLLVRAPSLMLFGYNWLQPPLAGMSVLAALTGTGMLLLAWFSRRARLDRGVLTLSFVWMIVAIAPAHPLLMIGADLTNSRNLHPGTVGLALLLAHLIARTVPSGARRWPVLLLVALLSAASLANIAAWQWTSRVTEQLLADTQRLEPTPAPNAEFVFYGVPQTVRGVFLLHEGMGEALRLAYRRSDVNARHATAGDGTVALSGPTIRLQWQGESEPLLRRVQDSSTPN